MKLESLPNEILLDLFIYFNSINLLQTFYGLNYRFNLLLYKQFRSHCFQFNLISKRHFDKMCQQHLPFIADRVIALQLSEYRETPEQIRLFFSYIPSFKPFIHLQSLTISNLSSYQTLVKLLDECQHLSNLIRLYFYSCSFQNSSMDSQLIINKIWSLPKLTCCHVHIAIKNEQIFSIPTIISRSLKSISLFSSDLQWDQINQLIEYTPHLKYLSTFIKSFPDPNQTESILPTLKKCNLHLFDVSDVSGSNICFQIMPNLHHLAIHICSGLINGHQWEYIIRNYLPQLKTFGLTMENVFLFEQSIQEKADELFNSFQTPFWINERKWFVHCFTANKTIYLSTRFDIPHYIDSIFPNSWRSTCPDDDLKQFFNNKTSIYNEIFFNKPVSSDIRLPNIKYLNIKLPLNDQLWSVVSNFNQLEILSVTSYTNKFSFQLQRLLDRASHLKKLDISQDASLPLQISLFKHTNESVRELHFYNYNHCFNEDECLLLIRSPLGVQCEVLSIQVNNRQNIIHLVKDMVNIRSLIVTCQDDEYYKQSKLTRGNTELITWLKQRLSVTNLIVRDPENDKNILIWI